MSDQQHCWIDRRVFDPAGELVGVVVDVYADADSGRPCWLAISRGYFGTRVLVAPAADASARGLDVVIAHRRDRVETAPAVHPLAVLSRRDEEVLRAHFGRPHRHHPPAPTPRSIP